MKYSIKLFAAARDYAGARELQVDLPEQATVAELRQSIVAACPKLAGLLPHAHFAVDNSYVADTVRIDPRSEIACIPPVSGG